MSNLKDFSLIVPAAADKAEYCTSMPYIFRPDDDGTMLCVKSIMGLNLQDFDGIYFTILRKHADAFDIDTLMRLQFKRLGLENAHLVILDEPTRTQAQTIEQTIRKTGIAGSVFIKDADGFFNAEIAPYNGIAVYPLEKMEMVDPRNKSYVAVDDMQHVTNIIEKRIVSNLFNAGGYCFEDATDFLNMYDELHKLGHIYLSHIIYAMLLKQFTFRPYIVKHYTDWGTQNLYRISNEN